MKNKKRQRILKWAMSSTLACFTLILSNRVPASANNTLGGPTHLGTFEGQTTFTTSSSNGINPGLYLEVMDRYGNLTQYESEDGIITVDGTQEGAYVTQAKLLGKTKYVDQDTGEILDTWEEGRNLKLESVRMPVLKTTGKNLFSGKVSSNGQLVYTTGGVNTNYKDFWTTEYFNVEPNKDYSFTMGSSSRYALYDENKKYISGKNSQSFNTGNATYVRLCGKNQYATLVYGTKIPSTEYEPYKSNILTVNEDVTLRSNGDVYDELNLLTGRLTQRIDENNEVLAQAVVKTVDLTSTYEFPPVNTRQVLVEGEILPLICSVTTPTEPLSFVLNPNLEEGHQFIAPDFTISNDSPASVSIELKNFEQTTNVLNDVQPDTYQNWSALNKLQSKDIALALIPKSGDGWETLQEGPRYVADNSNYYIGDIKANSSVDFTFEAFHGQAFTEALNPHYRLVALFEF